MKEEEPANAHMFSSPDSYQILSKAVSTIRKIWNRDKHSSLLAILGVVFVLLGVVQTVRENRPADGKNVIFDSDTASSSAVTVQKLKVDIEGAVVHPGMYELAAGDRVADAVSLSGGLTKKADSAWIAKNMNMAAKLTDGGKIYIPAVGEKTSGGSAESAVSQNAVKAAGESLGVSTGTVNINTASQKQLEDLPGVGPVIAGKIISGRSYSSAEELKTKKIVGNALFDKIKDLITVF